MAPVADAVGFVDHHQADRTVGDEAAQALTECLGRDIQQFQLAAAELFEALPALGLVERRIEQRRAKAEPLERIHLVLHQRDERRQDQHRAAEQLGRNLKRQRLAGAGRHQADAVATSQHGVDDLALTGPERLVAEERLEDLLGIGPGGERYLHASTLPEWRWMPG